MTPTQTRRDDAVLELHKDSPLHYDKWTGDYLDHFNNVWVTRSLGRKLWVVAYRDYGNASAVVGRFASLPDAIARAEQLITERSRRAAA